MTKKHYRLFIFSASLLLTQSCETFQPAQVEKTNLAKDAMISVEKEQKRTRQAVSSEEILDSLLPPVEIAPPIIEEDRFDISVKNIDARSFLLGLVDGTQYNMIVNPDVNVDISLQLKSVTVSEVLQSLERIYPLMIERENQFIYVSSAESMTRIHHYRL